MCFRRRRMLAVKGIGFLSALVLAAVFVWAAAAKLARPDRTGAGFAALGLGTHRWLVRGVPIIELGTAVLLVAAPPAGGAIALVLLGAFSAVIARALGRGVKAPCSCFGAASGRPISRTDLLRNAALAALAIAALVAAS